MELISERVDKINAMKVRELERKLNLQKKLDTKKSVMAENEQLEFFEKTFNDKRDHIESMLKQAQTLSKNELPEHFNLISKEILLLQKYVAASNLFLRTYFLQKCQNVLQELSVRSRDLENELLPKKKFGFKNKPVKVKETGTKTNGCDVFDSCKLNGGARMLISSSLNMDCFFSDKSDEVVTLQGENIAKKDVSLERLHNCTVYLKGFPSTLHLNYLTKCRIFSGPISTSIFAENCTDCTFVIACQQLRLHASKNINIYLQVTSRAIMEDCNQIGIAPYNWRYDGIEEDFVKAGLDRRVNNWKCVDDFNWLNVEKHSPHWRELDEEERIEDWP